MGRISRDSDSEHFVAQMLAYLLVAQPWRRPDIPQSSVQTVEEVMQHKPYTWYNCTLAQALSTCPILAPTSSVSCTESDRQWW